MYTYEQIMEALRCLNKRWLDICKEVRKCLGINVNTGDESLVLSEKGTWVNVIQENVLRWEKITIPYTAFTASATTESIAVYSVAPNQAIHTMLLKTSVVFNNTTTFTITGGSIGTLFSFSPALNCKTILNTYSVGNNGQLFIPNTISSTNILITASSSGGNVNAPTQGAFEMWLLTSKLP